jgi:hypothetical protein
MTNSKTLFEWNKRDATISLGHPDEDGQTSKGRPKNLQTRRFCLSANGKLKIKKVSS